MVRLVRERYNIVASVLLMLLVTLLSGCDSGSEGVTSPEALQMITEVNQQKDFNRMLSLADSLEKAGAMSEGDSYYWQGFANYRLRQRRTAEFYWKESLNATANLTDRASLDTYARSASYLTGLYVRYLNFTSAMKIVKPALEHLDRNHFTSSSDYTNLLIFAGCCEAHYNVNDSVVSAHFERAYHLHMDHIRANPSKETYRDAVVGFINIAYGWLSEKRYAQGLVWARYKIFSAFGLEGIGKMDEAAEAFAAFQQTRFADTLEGQLDAADYLAMSGHWKEAADKFLNLDRVFSSEQVSFSLEDIQRYLLKKYEANAMSGRKDSALAVAAQICERLDSAIIKSQWDDGEEKETIHQKEEQILQQQGRLMRARVLALIVTVIVLTLFFIIFTIIRHRSARRLAEMRAAKERMESELRIASDIQMSMLPRAFPEVEGLDMYASMDPAREVGGDLYSFLQKEDELYFCIGDVSGKGVPASLFMAQVTRLFHGMASYGMGPAEIATRMNAELVEDNEQSMFVTMFICRLNLKLNLLEYCNAGHNPPALGNVDGQFSFLDMLPNAPIGLWPGLQYKGESIEFFKDRMLLIYTDGLNEAENPQQDQFGEQRIIDILSSMNLSKAQDIVEKLRSEVNNFRNGAEPNDDLTMLCLKYHYEPEA